jgi:hypothetical protein
LKAIARVSVVITLFYLSREFRGDAWESSDDDRLLSVCTILKEPNHPCTFYGT